MSSKVYVAVICYDGLPDQVKVFVDRSSAEHFLATQLMDREYRGRTEGSGLYESQVW